MSLIISLLGYDAMLTGYINLHSEELTASFKRDEEISCWENWLHHNVNSRLGNTLYKP